MKNVSNNLKNFFNRITVKQILLIIVFGISISVLSCIIGYFEFSTTIRNIYNNEVAEIAQFLKENIDTKEFEQSMTLIEDEFYQTESPVFEQISQQPGYQQVVKQGEYLQNSFEGLDLFVGSFDEKYNENYLKYLEANEATDDETYALVRDEGNDVVCSYYRSPNLIPENRKINQPGGMFLASGSEQAALKKMYEEKTIQYLDSEIIMGDDSNESYTLFSIQDPILNDDGNVVGFINASLTVGILQRLLSRYLFLVGCLTVLIGIIFIIIYITINRRMFLNPILSIIKGTSSFVENNNQISEALTEIKTGDEIQTLAESVLKLENDINEYIDNLEEATKERERVQTELDLATNIQMSVLPQEFPAFPDQEGFDIYAIMDPAREVGGDFYNYFMIDDDHLGFVIGDVSGKGVPAALFMMIGNILIKAHSLPEKQANEIFEAANDILSENNAAMLFITSWMGVYELSTNTITFVNAGHEPPVLVHANGETELIKTKPNMVLGSFAGIPYKLNEVKIQKGDKIFIYTDGVPEAQNAEQEFYGIERMVDVVENTYTQSVEEIIKDIRSDIDHFVNGADQFDDITIVGLEIKNDPDNSDS